MSYGLVFWCLAGLMIAAFLLGGSARRDVASLAALYPLSALALGAGLLTLRWRHVQQYLILFIFAGAIFTLVLLQLLPLPPALHYAFPSHAIVAEVDRVANIHGVWRPLTLTPGATRSALWSLLPPAAVLVLGAQIPRAQHARLVALLLLLGVASALLALLQVNGPPDGPLYWYPITNNGSAVGFFANRNHQAVFLATLLPALALWYSLRPARRAAEARPALSHRPQYPALPPRLAPCLAAAAFLIPLILITGSRAGLLMAVVGLAAIPLLTFPEVSPPTRLSRNPGGGWRRKLVPWGIGLVLIGLVILTIWFERAVALDRLLTSAYSAELRVKIMPTLLQMIEAYMPWGSGIGSFEAVYLIHEPDSLLSPTVMNHAHNDWLELALEGGLPACLIAGAAVIAYFVSVFRNLSTRRELRDANNSIARLGLIVLLILGLASISDYPLRVPSLACLFVLAALWASDPKPRELAEREGQGRS